MEKLRSEITAFIRSAQAANICVTENNEPYCFTCLFVYAEQNDNPVLLFKSADDTAHSKKMLLNDKVAGTILPDIINTESICGIQFKGRCKKLTAQSDLLVREYYTKYPIAQKIEGSIWIITLDEIKYTDNRLLGIGNKLIWRRQ